MLIKAPKNIDFTKTSDHHIINSGSEGERLPPGQEEREDFPVFSKDPFPISPRISIYASSGPSRGERPSNCQN